MLVAAYFYFFFNSRAKATETLIGKLRQKKYFPDDVKEWWDDYFRHQRETDWASTGGEFVQILFYTCFQ